MILLTVAFFMGSPKSLKGYFTRFVSFLKPLLATMILFIIGSFVYLATFIPYIAMGHNLGDVFNLQRSMFIFHSQLQATHPFSSEWWSWPFIFKPLWLYFQALPNDMVSTITTMGNPVIWWVGLPVIIILLWDGIKEKRRTYLFLGLLFLFQWIPYAFISRSLFIYHFYSNVPIIVIALAAVLSELWNKPRNRKFVIIFLASALILFIAFFPVISGLPFSVGYVQCLKLFPSWVF
jgi:dolichyl-phosphate-mannose--protein O-mannosyl transferase